MSLRIVLHPGPCFDEYTFHLANVLAENLAVGLALDRRQIPRFQKWLHPSIAVLPYRRPRRRHVWGFLEMYRLAHKLRAFGADVLHIQGFGLWESVLARMARPIPLVNTVHDPVNHIDYRTPLNDFLLRDMVRQAQGWVVHSPGMKALLLQHHRGVDPQRVAIHPLGPYTYYRYLAPSPLPPRRPEVLFFGELRLNKGIDLLIQAFARIAPQAPRWRLIIAGRGRIPPETHPVLEGLIQQGRAELHNRFIPDEEVARRFAQAGIVALPYRHGTQSGVLAVAAALEAPVLATPVGALGETLHHEEEVFFVPPEDEAALAEGLLGLIQRPQLRTQLGQRLAKYAHEVWGWERAAQALIPLYAALVEARSHP